VRRLVLVRHGESVYNAEERIQGQRCAGLSDLGHAQAKVTAAALAEAYPDASIVTSDLQRTRETTDPLAAAMVAQPVEDPRIRERSFGAWEGRLRIEVQRDEPERWARWLAGEDVIGEIGGETRGGLADRVVPVFERMLAETSDGAVTIAVTHGGPVWHGLHRLLQLDRPILGGVSNCSVTELGSTGVESPRLLSWNEVGHLPLGLRVGWNAPAAASDGPAVGH
jgi:glucosyl-3-phosphoglycerate phosphatase